MRQRFVGPRSDPAGAENKRLDLLAAQHQRRKPEAGLEDITQPRFALDLRPLPLQARDIAVERSQGDAELVGENAPADRSPPAPERLQKREKPLRARQLPSPCRPQRVGTGCSPR